MLNNTIMESDDYALFTMSDKNRKISKRQVDKIKESIEVIGYINQAPILVDDNFVIIDWQHRFMACRELDLPIYYQMVDWDTNKIMISLNASQKNWGLPDYISHYSKQNIEWFVYFLEFQEKYNLPFTSTLALLTDTNTKNIWSKIKKWEWYEIYEYSKIIAEMVNRTRLYIDFATNRYFLRALVRVYSRAWIKWLLKVEENIMAVPKQFSSREYCVVFENIINRRKMNKNKVDLIGETYKAKWFKR